MTKLDCSLYLMAVDAQRAGVADVIGSTSGQRNDVINLLRHSHTSTCQAVPAQGLTLEHSSAPLGKSPSRPPKTRGSTGFVSGLVYALVVGHKKATAMSGLFWAAGNRQI